MASKTLPGGPGYVDADGWTLIGIDPYDNTVSNWLDPQGNRQSRFEGAQLSYPIGSRLQSNAPLLIGALVIGFLLSRRH